MSRLRSSLVRLTLFGALLIALTIGGLALHLTDEPGIGSDERLQIFIVLGCAAGVTWALAVRVVIGGALPARAIWIVLGIAVALRVAVLLSPPFLSSDVFRYVWDGRVQAAWINPYRYIPAAPELRFLRDTAVYENINRSDYAPTIYPPVAQGIFFAVAKIWSSPTGVRLAMVALETLGICCMMALLRRAALPVSRILVYAWNPLTVWEFAGNGHIDGAAIGFIGLAMLACVLRREVLAGLAIGAAIMCKFLPLVLAPAVWRRWSWRTPLAALFVIVAGYACYLGAGWRVLGFLPGYANEEGLGGGTGLFFPAFLREAVDLPPVAGRIWLGVAAVGLAAMAAWIAFASRYDGGRAEVMKRGGQAILLATALMVAVTPHYPWYYAWLALPSCLLPIPSVLFLSVAPILLYLDPAHNKIIWPSLVFLPFVVLAARDTWRVAGLARPLKTADAFERTL